MSWRKVLQIRALGVFETIDAVVVMARSALEPIGRQFVGAAERLVNLPNFVDERFWRSGLVPRDEDSYVVGVGRTRRDYASLVDAIGGLPVHLRLQASSQWHVTDRVIPDRLPPNVSVGSFITSTEMRSLYEGCRFVVVPLRTGQHHTAGTETMLEAMAMSKAVILASDYCPADYLVPDETGMWVRSGDVRSLREAMTKLIESPEQAAALGRAGRHWLETHMSYDASIRRLAGLATPGSGAFGGPTASRTVKVIGDGELATPRVTKVSGQPDLTERRTA